MAVTPAAGPDRPRRWPGVLAWTLWGLAIAGTGGVLWFDHLLRQAGRTDLLQLTADGAPNVLAIFTGTTAGAVLASRRPRNPVGWLLLALGLSVISSGVTDGYARYGLLARPGALPAADYLAVYAEKSYIAWPALLGFILLLTPPGPCRRPAGGGGPGPRPPGRPCSWRRRCWSGDRWTCRIRRSPIRC
jgi:hypothetical protein